MARLGIALTMLTVAALSVLPGTVAQAAAGGITTVAGSGPTGDLNGSFSGDGGPATSATLNRPEGVAVDGAGNLFIADTFNRRIRRVDAVTRIITTVAGNGTVGFSGDGGPATSARLFDTVDMAVDASGNLFIADRLNNRIRKVDAAIGVITTVAGSGIAGSIYNDPFSGDGGLATSATLNRPEGVAVDGAGNLFIADTGNYRIRRVDAATRIITTVAGTGSLASSGDGGGAAIAGFVPADVAVDATGNLFIADAFNHRIRRVAAATGVITTVAGNGTGYFSGDGGPATSASFGLSYDVVVDAAGNVFIPDDTRVRRVDATTGIITTVAGTGNGGFSGDGGPATSAILNPTRAVAVDTAGNLFIADTDNHRIRKVERVNAAPAKLAFTVQPSNALAGATISPAVQVAVQGSSGNTVTSATNSVTLAIGTNPSSGILSGTTTVNAVSGVVTLPNLSINQAGNGYTLAASATNLIGATSSAFNITVVGPPASTGLSAVPGNGQVTLSWNAVAGANSYILYMASTPWTTWISNLPEAMKHENITSPYLHTGLTNGTTYYFAVSAVGAGGESSQSGQVLATPSAVVGTTISGTVTLQARTSTLPTGVGHSIATVTLNPGNINVSVAADGSFQFSNVAAGTFTLTASATGYVSRPRTNVVVAASPVTLPSTQLRCGLVNSDDFVNINDITATVASFGTSPAARVDAQGRFVDQNGDGFVNINDITCVVSGFGVTSPLPWE
jgi:hypothetical protein